MRDLTSQWEAHRTPVLANYHNLYNPRIIEESGEYPFRMWFFGWAVEDSNPIGGGKYLGDAVYHARSKDLLKWEVYSGKDASGHLTWDTSQSPKLWAPVLSVDRKPFDNAANGDPSVVKRNGVYYMAFSSVGFDTKADTNPQHMYLINCIMGAKSSDGITWEKTKAPILIWDKEYENRWDIAGAGPNPQPPSDYYGSYHRPSLMYDRGRWKIWFDYYHPGTFVSMGYAENTGDFMNPADWKVVRSGKTPLLKDWPNPSVVRVGDRYYAFSDAPYYPAALGGDGRLITMAESHDGISWKVLGHIRPDGMESSHVPEAFVRKDRDGTWLYVFYSWKPETKSDKTWDYRYKQLRFVRRKMK